MKLSESKKQKSSKQPVEGTNRRHSERCQVTYSVPLLQRQTGQYSPLRPLLRRGRSQPIQGKKKACYITHTSIHQERWVASCMLRANPSHLMVKTPLPLAQPHTPNQSPYPEPSLIPLAKPHTPSSTTYP